MQCKEETGGKEQKFFETARELVNKSSEGLVPLVRGCITDREGPLLRALARNPFGDATLLADYDVLHGVWGGVVLVIERANSLS